MVSHGVGLDTPELIARDVRALGFLTALGSGDRVADLRRFMTAHADLYGQNPEDIAALHLVADYINPDGMLAWVHLEQRLNGRPVFQGEIKAGFAPDGAIIRTIGQLAPRPDHNALATQPGSIRKAAQAAARAIAVALPPAAVAVVESRHQGHELVLARGPFAQEIPAQTLYFPIEPGVLRLAWRFVFWQADAAWMVVVDAETNTVLWRKRLTEHQTQSASYGIYPREAPMNYWPGPSQPTDVEGPLLARQTTPAFVGNEPPYGFNDLGWITDGSNLTDGNNVEAGLDRVAPDGIDAGGHALGNPHRIFVFGYNPAPGNPAPGEQPLHPGYPPTLSDFQRGAISNVFYWSNRFHDLLYLRGFTEPARNFQHDNFGRGGLGGDRVSAEVQDTAASNNATFTAPPDGMRGRMQLHLFTAQTPQRDAALDQTVLIHELAHGLSSRLIGNGSGLLVNEARALGEGWSDFVALSLLQDASHPLDGLYPFATYVARNTSQFTGYPYVYYGYRRFPYAAMSSRGGTANLPHAPQTFADIDPARMRFLDGAFAHSPFPAASATDIHNMGEIWALALLEGRKRLIERLGYAEGNTRMLQIVVDGMKLSPLNPTFVQARDAVLAAALALGSAADVDDLWHGFAIRGLGIGASRSGNAVVESFLVPQVNQQPDIVLDDGQCNASGHPDPGEPVFLDISLTNLGASTALQTRLSINGAMPIEYGAIAAGATEIRRVAYTVPAALTCGDALALELAISSSLGTLTEQRAFVTGTVLPGPTEDFDSTTAPALPTGWTSTTTGSGQPWTTVLFNPFEGTASAFVRGAETVGETSLVTPAFTASGGPIRVVYAQNHVISDPNDGMVLEVAIGAGGNWTEIEEAGGHFLSGGYNNWLRTRPCEGSPPNPLGGRRAWTGNSGGYVDVDAVVPGIAAGSTVRLRWRLGSDCLQASNNGIHIDSVVIARGRSCSAPSCQDRIFRDGFEGLD